MIPPASATSPIHLIRRVRPTSSPMIDHFSEGKYFVTQAGGESRENGRTGRERVSGIPFRSPRALPEYGESGGSRGYKIPGRGRIGFFFMKIG